MKKKYLAGLGACLITCGMMVDISGGIMMPVTAGGDKAVYHQESGTYWYPDLSGFVGMTYNEQIKAINKLNGSKYLGLNSWHLASVQEVESSIYPEIHSGTNALLFTPTKYDGHLGGDYDVLVTEYWGRLSDTHGIFDSFGYDGRATFSWINNWVCMDYGIISDIGPTINGTQGYVADTLQDQIGVINFVGEQDYYFGEIGVTTWDNVSAWVTATPAEPVPEPATMLLFCTGLVGIIGARIRKKK
jgi:hypothetical protein